MLVDLENLGDTKIQRLTVTDPQQNDVRVGEVVGYRCEGCKQADETRHQIWHSEDCSLAGDHGRAHYDDDFEPTFDVSRPTPEFHPEHEIQVVKYNDNWVLGFRCSCGNLDECAFEVIHDQGCGLADEDCPEGQTDVDEFPDPPAMTDGGQ